MKEHEASSNEFIVKISSRGLFANAGVYHNGSSARCWLVVSFFTSISVRRLMSIQNLFEVEIGILFPVVRPNVPALGVNGRMQV